MKFIIIIALLSIGCTKTESIEIKSKYVTECEHTSNRIERCENIEVICYKYLYGGGVDCKFK